jgi:23S rRNA pseudouridine1911/1915/1917 synthase
VSLAAEAARFVEVGTGDAGERLDAFIARALLVSRAIASGMVERGEARVDDQLRPRSYRLREGQTVALPARLPNPPALEAEPGELRVLFEDEGIIVVDKPPGLVVHPGAGRREGTLAGRLLAAYPELRGVGEPHRPGIVHRLDRETSGLLVVARNAAALSELQNALRRHEIVREYLALVVGRPGLPKGSVDAPIGVDPSQRGRRAVRAGGRTARTHYEVLNCWSTPECALLRVTLETGRTHQVRVHLAAIGLPVAGDRTYGRRRASGDLPLLSRPFLHAFRLQIPGRPVIESPLPPDLRAVVDTLGPPT